MQARRLVSTKTRPQCTQITEHTSHQGTAAKAAPDGCCIEGAPRAAQQAAQHRAHQALQQRCQGLPAGLKRQEQQALGSAAGCRVARAWPLSGRTLSSAGLAASWRATLCLCSTAAAGLVTLSCHLQAGMAGPNSNSPQLALAVRRANARRFGRRRLGGRRLLPSLNQRPHALQRVRRAEQPAHEVVRQKGRLQGAAIQRLRQLDESVADHSSGQHVRGHATQHGQQALPGADAVVRQRQLQRCRKVGCRLHRPCSEKECVGWQASRG